MASRPLASQGMKSVTMLVGAVTDGLEFLYLGVDVMMQWQMGK